MGATLSSMTATMLARMTMSRPTSKAFETFAPSRALRNAVRDRQGGRILSVAAGGARASIRTMKWDTHAAQFVDQKE
jgi:glycerate-2-kinase